VSDEALRIEREGGIAVLRLCQPESRNALTAALREALEARLPALLAEQDVRCLLITGSGSTFSAGGDITSFLRPMSPGAVRARMARSHAWIEALLTAEKPVVTAVNGPAVGAGFGLAMLGDIVLAARRAWFMSGFSTIAVAADYALARTLPRAVGAIRAKDILFSGRRVEAEEAERIGLVARLVDDAMLETEALGVARQLAEGPTLALGLTKTLVAKGFELGTAAYLEAEGFAQATAFGSTDHREGVSAFLEKRKPRFEGR